MTIRLSPVLVLFLATSILTRQLAVAQEKEASSDKEQAGSRTDISEDDSERVPVLLPPKLIQFATPDYPESIQQEGIEGEVVVKVLIEADGTVSETQIVESLHPQLDEAALRAAKKLIFEPATRDGEKIAARVNFPFVFEIQRIETTTGMLSGQIRGVDEDEPLAGAEVVVVGAAGSYRAVSDEEGKFRIKDVEEGSYEVIVRAAEFNDSTSTETVGAGEETRVVYRLSSEERQTPNQAEYGATARVKAPAREVTKRTIPKEELTSIPGTRGDALRAVELLPGVARPPGGLGAFIVRGSAPNDSQVFLNSTPIPLLYHFGGLTSVYNSRLLEEIDFVPGNFSVRYGRKVGGILEVKTRSPSRDAYHGVAELGVIDGSILLEGPLGEHFSFAAAARRSFIDLVFENVIPDDAFGVVTAPVYYDYQFILNWHPTDNHELELHFYGADDQLRLLFDDAFSDNPQVRGALSIATNFNLFQLRWDWKINSEWKLDVDLQAGPVNLGFNLGDDLELDLDLIQMNYRAELEGRIHRSMTLRAGIDLLPIYNTVSFRGPPLAQGEGGTDQNALATGEPLEFSDSGLAYRSAAYVELDTRIIEPLQMLFGLRLDYFGDIKEWSLDPRFMIGVDINEQWKIKGGVGLFSQPPEYREASPELGNPNLEASQAVHFGAGIEYKPFDFLNLGVDGFYKHIWGRPVSTEGGRPPGFESDGFGRIYGLEVSGRLKPTDKLPLFAYLSYTLSRSERRDGRYEDWRLFDFDQTHIFTIAGVYKLPKGFSVGATFRLVTGNPFTPYLGAVYDVRSDTYTPIPAGVNSARSGTFHRLDIRAEKIWDFDVWKLALFLDIQNVYNRMNPEGRTYNYDYTDSEVISGLPIIPAFGLRGEF